MNPLVDEFIDGLEEQYISPITHCRALILSLHPAMEERFSYKCPFYYYLGSFCYIYVSKGELILGLVHGHLYSNEQGVLTANDRKQIRHVVISSWNAELAEQVRQVLIEGMMIQEERKKQKPA